MAQVAATITEARLTGMPQVVPRSAPLSASARLQLMWLASPALPVGGFSYSEGLEAAVDRARVTTEATASNWLQDQLHLTLARGDLAVMAKAIPAWRRGDLQSVNELNQWLLQTRETSELRAQASMCAAEAVL